MRTSGGPSGDPLPAGEPALVAAALALGAESVPPWSGAERALAARAGAPPAAEAVAALRATIGAGGDPLGEAFRALRSPAERRPLGATYTPSPIIEAMVAWAAGAEAAPARVVDPGSGSARFAVAAGRRFPGAELVAVEVDPLAGLIGRATLAAAGLAGRARVELVDYRRFHAPPIDGRTLYIGNPPYVRHHLIAATDKEWLARTAAGRSLRASRLAGLHVHFFLATAEAARAGDLGAFITSAEWLDVNYGRLVRELLLERLGGRAVHVLEPTALPFEDAATTAAITLFEVGGPAAGMRMRRVRSVAEIGRLEGGRPVPRAELAAATRWSPLTRPARAPSPDCIELGEICRVHRGAVTGSNATFVRDASVRLPERVLLPTVTRARELFAAGEVLAVAGHLRRVVDIPPDYPDHFDAAERRQIERFLRAARREGVPLGYIARTRRAWWSVGLRAPAPILATYMARRPPVFVRNAAAARHINIAHGLYPRAEMSAEALDRLAAALRATASVEDGRTYSGGLTKFEPREMERLLVPRAAVGA
jgi:adenine-specific DNA-methyltransferase